MRVFVICVSARVHSEGVCWCRDPFFFFFLDFIVIDLKKLARLENVSATSCLFGCVFLHVYCRCLCACVSCLLSLCLHGSLLIRAWWVGVPGPVINTSKRLLFFLSLCVRASYTHAERAPGHSSWTV